jgi:hypothetical protein
MPQARDIKDSARWRTCAEEFRELAEDVCDEQVRQSMLRLAKAYEHLAIRAEKRSGVESGALISIAIIVAAFAILMLCDRWAG